MDITRLKNQGILIKTKLGRLSLLAEGKILVEGNGEPVTLAGPGEYEAKGFSLTGKAEGSYLIEAEEIRVGLKTDGDEVNVLLTDSWDKVGKSQPNMVIPLNESLQQEMVKSSGIEPRREKKLTLSKLNLPQETELVLLEA